jgi:Ca-activated chloride channel family protein
MFEHFALLSPFALLLLPLFIFLNIFSRKEQLRYYMPHVKFLHLSLRKPSSLRKVLKWTMIISSIFAFSMPVYYNEKPMVQKNTIDIVLALDISGSMSLYGFNPEQYKQTRLDAVKEVVSRFITQRKNDRVGLVVFGTYSTIASPLSFERQAQQRIVQGLQIGALGKSTALLDAVVSSVRYSKRVRVKVK